MSRVITFSRNFPASHPNKGKPTFFVEKMFASFLSLGIKYHYAGLPMHFLATLADERFEPKHHTIRAGERWEVGDKFSPRIWSDKPYNSKQIILAPDVEIKKVWPITIMQQFEKGIGSLSVKVDHGLWYFENDIFIEQIAANDGLSMVDFRNWFKDNIFIGQCICWNENINYNNDVQK